MKFIRERLTTIKNEKNQKDQIREQENKKIEDDYWAKMEARIAQIKEAKKEVAEAELDSTRKFLLLNIMPILTKGLLEVCKINPIDPIDHLVTPTKTG